MIGIVLCHRLHYATLYLLGVTVHCDMSYDSLGFNLDIDE